tara:strand:- start:1782 stop:2243 length:462 start_codon:yes stop_codon:yes gene_type:complete
MDMNHLTALPFQQNDITAIPEKGYHGFDLDAMSDGDIMGAFFVPFKCDVWQSILHVVEVIAGAEAVIQFAKQTLGTETDAATVGAITVPLTTAAGKCMYDNVARMSVSLDQGDWVIVTATTVASTTTGIVQPGLIVVPNLEIEANISDMVETA